MDKYKLWFAAVNLNDEIKSTLLREFKRENNIYDYALSMNEGSYKVIDKLREAMDESKLEMLYNTMEKENIKLTTLNDEEYPRKLKELENMPYGLFYKGTIESLNNLSKKISIIGSRNCTFYGKNIVELVCNELKDYDIQIVSGLARGIDGEAHKGALKNNLYTCGILGCGLNIIYPKSNKSIYNEILEKDGCIISQFLPDDKPEKFRFPLRNKIISGLSDMVLVIEADERSGTLITTTWALDQGKDVMAVPGNIFSPQCKGTNKLIKEGALVFSSIDDIINTLNIKKIKKQKNKSEEENSGKDKLVHRVYKVLTNNPIHIDDIVRITDVDIKQLYKVLFEMQLRDEVYCLNSNYYVKVNKSI